MKINSTISITLKNIRISKDKNVTLEQFVAPVTARGGRRGGVLGVSKARNSHNAICGVLVVASMLELSI